MDKQRGPAWGYIPKPGEYVVASAHMGSCPMVRPTSMSMLLPVDVEGIRITHSPELTTDRIVVVEEIDDRGFDSPTARAARFRENAHGRRVPYEWDDVDLRYEAWRHSILCRVVAPLSPGELLALGVPTSDHWLYRSIYARFAPAELFPVDTLHPRSSGG